MTNNLPTWNYQVADWTEVRRCEWYADLTRLYFGLIPLETQLAFAADAREDRLQTDEFLTYCFE